MTTDKTSENMATELRRHAEEQVASQQPVITPDGLNQKRLLHELQVYQVELEMQNEELRRVVAEKSEHEEHLRNIIMNTPAGYFQLDQDGRILDVNSAWLHMHGYDSREEVIGKNFSIMQVDSSSDSALVHLAELKQGKAIPFGEFSSRRKDGSTGHHVFSANPMVQWGNIIGYEWFIIDISERKQMEEVQSFLLQINALQSGEEYFKVLAGYLATILDMDFVCIDRLEEDGLSARNVAVWCDGHFADNVTYLLKDTPSVDVVGKTVSFIPAGVRHLFPRVQVLQHLGAESYIGVTLWSHKHEPIGLIAVSSSRPLTNCHLAESIMNLVGIRAAGEVERMAEENIRQNLETQLLFAQKMESLGVLAGGIAHDFNNILAAIVGSCSLARMHPQKAEEYLDLIESSAMRAAGLCSQMLAYAGKGHVIHSQVNMGLLLDDMIKMLRATIKQNVEITTDFAADIPLITADESQLRQIVMNLIINAAEAIGELQGEISVSLTRSQVKTGQSERNFLGKTIPTGWYVSLIITDTGCGMDDVVRQRLFEPFYSTKFTGRGLGLSAVLGIVLCHGGALQLFSQPGHGTTFNVLLPIKEGFTTAEAPLPLDTVAPWKGVGTVLLVEDEEMIMTIAKIMLEELGFTVIGARNGKEALDQYNRYSTDISLVLTDIGMPQMDGYALFHELKKLNPSLPIIISSGFGDADVIAHISREKLAGIVSKPYNFVQLQEVFKKTVESLQ